MTTREQALAVEGLVSKYLASKHVVSWTSIDSASMSVQVAFENDADRLHAGLPSMMDGVSVTTRTLED